MKTDTQHLDWLEADLRLIEALLSKEGKPRHWSVNISGWEPTLRKAIDNAMEAEQEISP